MSAADRDDQHWGDLVARLRHPTQHRIAGTVDVVTVDQVDVDCALIDAEHAADPTWGERRSRCDDAVRDAMTAIDHAEPDRDVARHLRRALAALEQVA